MKAERISKKRTTPSRTLTVKLQWREQHRPGAEIEIVALAAVETAAIADPVVVAEAAVDAVGVDADLEAVVAAADLEVATEVAVVPGTKK